MNRRTFLKISGMGSIAFTAGCTSQPKKNLYTLVDAPDDMVTGKAAWYATTCRECPAGCGVLAKNREGRVIKLEGHPGHPINAGRLCMRGQAALQGLYDPDRLRGPLLKEKKSFRPIGFQEAEALLAEKISAATAKGRDRIRMVTEVTGASLNELLRQCLEKWNANAPIIFEPLAYEALKTAHELAFGKAALPSYAMEKADVVVGFGADFLETWLSPVEYARKFKDMHAFDNGRKGRFHHVAPYQSLTGANADFFYTCRPETEWIAALGLIRRLPAERKEINLPPEVRESLLAVSSRYSPEKTAEATGLTPEELSRLAQVLIKAKKPLVLGLSAASGGPTAPAAELAVLALNLMLDPELSLFDFSNTHRVETAARRSEVNAFFKAAAEENTDVLLLYNTNPLYHLRPEVFGKTKRPGGPDTFVVSFSACMDETALSADLVFPVAAPLESWDEYGGKGQLISLLQPAMGRVFNSPGIGDLFLRLAFADQAREGGYAAYIAGRVAVGNQNGKRQWLRMVQSGGEFTPDSEVKNIEKPEIVKDLPQNIEKILGAPFESSDKELTFIAAPSIRFFDGRGANKAWLAEIPDSVTQIAWQSLLLLRPETLAEKGLDKGQTVSLATAHGKLRAAVYPDPGVHRQAAVMAMGQGHTAYGRFARNQGISPLALLPLETVPLSGHPVFRTEITALEPTNVRMEIAHMDGNPYDHGRKIALTVGLADLAVKDKGKIGLTMHDFPLTLPLPEGYDPKRDIYPAHDHDIYRWCMVVDLERCIGCGACAAACYAENNIGIAGEKQIIRGREMSWIRIERYRNPDDPARMIFLPMLCQHCDNAPCESVCPVYAPHHDKEGLNNQIYNRCIGTRFCAQNCPYKVRRFNWFTWQWPDPLHLQLNPNVTVRGKGVMEKCSFCVQRIKEAHGIAKDEKRLIRDGEVAPACVQTCPTGALFFGSLMDANSRVRKLTQDRRAYQVMGYLNTKPAVIYLKKVVEKSDAPSHGDEDLHV